MVKANPKDHDCKSCTHRHCTPAPSEDWPQSRGPASYPMFELPGFGEFRTCLKPMVTDKSKLLMRLYEDYRAGHLPRTGGMLDQPAAFVRAVEILRNAYGH